MLLRPRITILLLWLLLSGCSTHSATTSPVQTEITPNTEATPSYSSKASSSTIETIYLESVENNPDSFYPELGDYPNLWTQIREDDITIYPFDWLADYTYDENGSLWMVGGFGVIKRDLDGHQIWYSMRNGLPSNSFSRVAVSPSGEVWIGGSNNTLFRLEGEKWVNEGEKLPLPFDDRTQLYVCYSKTITGIDFGPDGSVWVMNAGIEIYRHVYGQWINFPFPKEILPAAGGGACPLGIRVQADDNITIKLSPC